MPTSRLGAPGRLGHPIPSTDAQLEQDLVLSRALVELYSRPAVAKALALRGGTALHKQLLPRPGRYSEDIDLVQVAPGPIGPVLDAVREALDPWLGEPGRKQTAEGATVVYRIQSSGLPVQPMRLEVEINTREHGSCTEGSRCCEGREGRRGREERMSEYGYYGFVVIDRPLTQEQVEELRARSTCARPVTVTKSA